MTSAASMSITVRVTVTHSYFLSEWVMSNMNESCLLPGMRRRGQRYRLSAHYQTLQNTAQVDILKKLTEIHYNTLQHTTTRWTHCNTRQHIATLCNAPPDPAKHCPGRNCHETHRNNMQHAATHCNTLQHPAKHCNTLQNTAIHYQTLQDTAQVDKLKKITKKTCNTLQHAAKHYITLQHTATHCYTLQHTATHCQILPHTTQVVL